jgi:cation transport ATPase
MPGHHVITEREHGPCDYDPRGTLREPHLYDDLRQRLLVSAVLSVPVILFAMVPALQFRDWQWLSLTLAAPVAVWGAWPFHRAAAINARHRAATMDTLISVGVLAAFGWSLWALFLGGAGEPNARMGSGADGSGAPELYLEVAAGVTVLILLGRGRPGEHGWDGHAHLDAVQRARTTASITTIGASQHPAAGALVRISAARQQGPSRSAP